MGATPPGALLAIGVAAPPTASVHSSSQHASTRVLSPVLDTDDGLGDRHRGVRRGWWDSADDLHHHRAGPPDDVVGAGGWLGGGELIYEVISCAGWWEWLWVKWCGAVGSAGAVHAARHVGQAPWPGRYLGL